MYNIKRDWDSKQLIIWSEQSRESQLCNLFRSCIVVNTSMMRLEYTKCIHMYVWSSLWVRMEWPISFIIGVNSLLLNLENGPIEEDIIVVPK